MNWIGGSLPNSNHSSSLVPFETVNSNHQLDIHRNCKSVICVIWWIRLHQLDPSDLHQLDIPVLAYITNDMQIICKLGRIELAAIFFLLSLFLPSSRIGFEYSFLFPVRWNVFENVYRCCGTSNGVDRDCSSAVPSWKSLFWTIWIDFLKKNFQSPNPQ